MKHFLFTLIALFILSCGFVSAQNVGVDVASPVEKLDVAGAIRVGNTTNANAGTLRWTGTAFEGYNGSVWLNLGSPGGITSLNTLTGAVQTFAIGSAGTAPAFSPSGTVHTLNIPFASTSGVTGGILSNTQYTTLLNGILPSGLTGQTLRHNGTTWVANSVIYNDGTNVGIGQTPGAAYLDVAGTNGGTTSLQLRSGNPGTGGTSSQITFGYNGTENYRQAIKTRHQSSGTSNAIDFYVWDQPNDVATTIGTLNVMSITGLNNGSVGIGVNAPGAQLHTTGSVRFAGLTAASQTAAVMTDGSGNLSTRALNPVAFSGTLANHTAGTGLSGSVYDGSAAQTWSVAYGTTGGTAVQGNQAATITAGNGLTGGISADALGDGFTSSLAVGAGTGIVVNADDIALATVGTAGTYKSVTTDIYGRVTAGTNPTTLAGYGITDAAPLSGGANYIQNLSVDNNFAAGQSASFDVTGNAEIGGILEVSGNVGIGTTAPGGPLQVNTSTAGRYAWYHAFGSFSVFNPETFVGEIRVGEASGRPGLYSSGRLELQASATGILFGTSNAEHMRLTSAGRLGIGTSNPSNLLTVEGPGEQALLHNPTNDGSIGINFNENSANAARIHHEGDYSSGYLELEDYSSGWTSTGLVIKQNNVGISSLNPQNKLNVVSTSLAGGTAGIIAINSAYTLDQPPADIRAANAGIGHFSTTANVRSAGIYGWVPTGGHGTLASAAIFDRLDNNRRIFIGGSQTSSINPPSLHVYNTSSGVTDFIVDNTGNVGIGSITPLTPFDVVGSSIAAFTGSTRGIVTIESPYTLGNYLALDFTGAVGNPPNARIAASFTGGGSTISFGTSNNYSSGITNTAMSINQVGNVGIGALNPQSRLNVENTNLGGGTSSIIAINSAYATAQPLSDVRAAITGIGHFSTTANVRSAGIYGFVPTGGHGTLASAAIFDRPDNNRRIFIGGSQTSINTPSFHVYNTSTTGTDFIIDNTGNVGVGILAPTAALDVNGKIRGTTSMGYGSSSVTGATTSTSDVMIPDISATLTVQTNDVVKVDLACNISSTASGFTYMRTERSSGATGSWLQSSNWLTSASAAYTGGYSTGLWRASADGSVTFQAQWHVGSGTGNYVYCNINAVVIGK